MKKILTVLVLATLFATLFVGCKKAAEKTTEEPANEPVKEQQLVTFLSEPEDVDYKTIFVGDKMTVLKKYYGWSEDSKYFAFDEYSTPRVYLTGTFNEGKYATQKLYLVKLGCAEMCMQGPFYRFTVNKDGTWTLLKKYSDEWEDWLVDYAGNLFDNADETVIDQLDFPDTITDSETRTTFKRAENNPNSFVNDISKYKIFEDKTAGTTYVDRETECTFVAKPDGTVQQYNMLINFSLGAKDPSVEQGPESGEVFSITWNDGTKETGLYSYKGAYGFFGPCFYVRNSEYPMETFTEVGKTGNGDSVYSFAYTDHQALKDFYEMAFPSYMETDKLSYEDFLAKHPLFYWKDAYGRLIEFGRSEFKPVAEIGKPVIYLYPEKDMNVNVRVEPKNGMSVSEPQYGRDGWNVLAKVGGTLVNSDGGVYPYLFWEGLNLDYRMPVKGFVVAARNVEGFLKEKLAVLGLNEVETADFMEFWYPKFNSAPYYYITFMEKAEFDKLAPLTVTPAPDSVIRVYMDYAPLLKPVKVTEPVLKTPERKGFTVVEWGGALHR
jgi:hypothetical protein